MGDRVEAGARAAHDLMCTDDCDVYEDHGPTARGVWERVAAAVLAAADAAQPDDRYAAIAAEYGGTVRDNTPSVGVDTAAVREAYYNGPRYDPAVVLALCDELDAAREERQRVKAAILDIDAHATPFGEDEDGNVTGGYLITVGSLHRALAITGAAAKCRDLPCERAAVAEAEVAHLRAQVTHEQNRADESTRTVARLRAEQDEWEQVGGSFADRNNPQYRYRLLRRQNQGGQPASEAADIIRDTGA